MKERDTVSDIGLYVVCVECPYKGAVIARGKSSRPL